VLRALSYLDRVRARRGAPGDEQNIAAALTAMFAAALLSSWEVVALGIVAASAYAQSAIAGVLVLVVGVVVLLRWRLAAMRWRFLTWRAARGLAANAGAMGLERGGRAPRLVKMTRTVAGARALLDLRATGITMKELTDAAPRIASVWSVEAVEVEPHAARPGMASLRVVMTDVLAWDAGAGPAWPWLEREAATAPSDDPIPVGLDRDGEIVAADPSLSILLAGASGSGKSVLLQNLLAGLALGGHHLYIADPARVEAATWTAVAEDEPALGIDDDLGNVVRLAEKVVGIMDSRLAEMDARGMRKAPADWPRVVLVVDELAALTAAAAAGGKPAKEGLARVQALCSRILREGRKTRVIMIGAVQKADQASVGPFRDNFGFRSCGYVPTKSGSDMALGDGAADVGADASTLDPRMKGMSWLITDDYPGPRLMRSFFIADADLDAVATRVAIARGLPSLAPDTAAPALAAASAPPVSSLDSAPPATSPGRAPAIPDAVPDYVPFEWGGFFPDGPPPATKD